LLAKFCCSARGIYIIFLMQQVKEEETQAARLEEFMQQLNDSPGKEEIDYGLKLAGPVRDLLDQGKDFPAKARKLFFMMTVDYLANEDSAVSEEEAVALYCVFEILNRID